MPQTRQELLIGAHLAGETIKVCKLYNKENFSVSVDIVSYLRPGESFPFTIDEKLNIVKRLNYEEASQWLPAKLCNYPPVLHRQRLIDGGNGYEFCYCEMRGSSDSDQRVVANITRFLFNNSWLCLVVQADKSLLFLLPTSQFTNDLGLTEAGHIYVLHCLFCREQGHKPSPSKNPFIATPLPVPTQSIKLQEAPWYSDEVVVGGAEEGPGSITELILGTLSVRDERPSKSRVSLAEYKKRRSTMEEVQESTEAKDTSADEEPPLEIVIEEVTEHQETSEATQVDQTPNIQDIKIAPPTNQAAPPVTEPSATPPTVHSSPPVVYKSPPKLQSTDSPKSSKSTSSDITRDRRRDSPYRHRSPPRTLLPTPLPLPATFPSIYDPRMTQIMRDAFFPHQFDPGYVPPLPRKRHHRRRSRSFSSSSRSHSSSPGDQSEQRSKNPSDLFMKKFITEVMGNMNNEVKKVDECTQTTNKVTVGEAIQAGSGFKLKSRHVQVSPKTCSQEIQCLIRPKRVHRRQQTELEVANNYTQTYLRTKEAGSQTRPKEVGLLSGMSALFNLEGLSGNNDLADIGQSFLRGLSTKWNLHIEDFSDYDTASMSLDSDLEDAQPSPVVSGASNISDEEFPEIYSPTKPTQTDSDIERSPDGHVTETVAPPLPAEPVTFDPPPLPPAVKEQIKSPDHASRKGLADVSKSLTKECKVEVTKVDWIPSAKLLESKNVLLGSQDSDTSEGGTGSESSVKSNRNSQSRSSCRDSKEQSFGKRSPPRGGGGKGAASSKSSKSSRASGSTTSSGKSGKDHSTNKDKGKGHSKRSNSAPVKSGEKTCNDRSKLSDKAKKFAAFGVAKKQPALSAKELLAKANSVTQTEGGYKRSQLDLNQIMANFQQHIEIRRVNSYPPANPAGYYPRQPFLYVDGTWQVVNRTSSPCPERDEEALDRLSPGLNDDSVFESPAVKAKDFPGNSCRSPALYDPISTDSSLEVLRSSKGEEGFTTPPRHDSLLILDTTSQSEDDVSMSLEYNRLSEVLHDHSYSLPPSDCETSPAPTLPPIPGHKELTILGELQEEHSYSLLTKAKKKRPKPVLINNTQYVRTSVLKGKGNKKLIKEPDILTDTMATKLDHSTCLITLSDREFEDSNNSKTRQDHTISPENDSTSVWEDIFPRTEHVQKKDKSVRRSSRTRSVSKRFRDSWLFSETDEEDYEPMPSVRCCPNLKPQSLLQQLRSET